MRNTLLFIVLIGWLTAGLSRAEEPDAKTREGWRKMSQLGSGFVVWESNRTGHRRPWRRELDGSGLRQISPDESGREHFCPHLAPDGKRLVYLSYPTGSDTYQEKEPTGGVPLYLMQADGSGNKRLTGSARAYGEDRAAVRLDNDHLVYIDREGFTRRIDVRNGASTRVTATRASARASSSTLPRPMPRPGTRPSRSTIPLMGGSRDKPPWEVVNLTSPTTGNGDSG
jgi:hypothetical protein